jgi:anaphase-promoting complex subunit 2
VSNLVGEGGDLIDDNEQAGPIQSIQEEAEDYGDANWVPEPNDAEPGTFSKLSGSKSDGLYS